MRRTVCDWIKSTQYVQRYYVYVSSHSTSGFVSLALLLDILFRWLVGDLLGNTNNTWSGSAIARIDDSVQHTTSWTRTGVTSLLALLTLTLSEIISAGVDDDGAAKDALRSDELDQLVGDGTLSVTLTISLEVAQVANVTLAVRWSAVGLAVRVDWQVLVVLLRIICTHEAACWYVVGRNIDVQ